MVGAQPERPAAAGVTLIELVVTMVVMGVAVGFICSAYVIAMRTWTANSNALDNIRLLTRLRHTVDSRLTSCVDVIQRSPSTWLLVGEGGDTARLEHAGGTLRVRDSVLNAQGEVSSFSVEHSTHHRPLPVVAIRLVVSSHGTLSELAWRLPCRGSEGLSDRIPRAPVQHLSVSGLYWEKR